MMRDELQTALSIPEQNVVKSTGKNGDGREKRSPGPGRDGDVCGILEVKLQCASWEPDHSA